MKDEYIIINKTAIQKRIEELEKELAYHNEWYEKAREKYHQDRKSWGNADDGELRVASDAASTTAQEIKILKEILSNSAPIIPEIEKAFVEGQNRMQHEIIEKLGLRYQIQEVSQSTILNMEVHSEDYISNLKLDI